MFDNISLKFHSSHIFSIVKLFQVGLLNHDYAVFRKNLIVYHFSDKPISNFSSTAGMTNSIEQGAKF